MILLLWQRTGIQETTGTGLLLSLSIAKHCDLKQSHKIQSYPKTAALRVKQLIALR